MHFCLIQLNNKQWWFAAGSMLWKMVHTEDMKMQSRWEALCGPWTSSAGRTNMWAFKSRQQRFNFPKPHSYQNLNKDLSKSQISMCSPQISLGSHPQSFHVWCGKCSCFWMGELDHMHPYLSSIKPRPNTLSLLPWKEQRTTTATHSKFISWAVISGSLGWFNQLGFFLPHIDKAVHHLQKVYNTSNRSISEPSSHKSW